MSQIQIISKFAQKALSALPFYDNIVVIGVGASVSNSKALLPFFKFQKRICFIDTVEQEYIDEKLHLLNLENTILVAISKSGSTDETCKILKYILQNKIQDPICYFVSENENSELGKIASMSTQAIFIKYEESKSGRFSIFQNASLLPLVLAGVNNKKLFSDIIHASKAEYDDSLSEIITRNINSKRNMLVISVYNRNMLGLAEWVRQIVSESLGKNKYGITPVISLGSSDEHSQLQLYLDGPDDKLYYILPIGTNENSELSQTNKNHHQAFVNSLLQANRPVIMEEKLQLTIITKWVDAIIEIASQKSINPYDQPAVDKAKKLFL